MADEQQAIDFLTNTAKDAAKGLAEESEVYRIAENIVEDNKALFGTVNTILNKELGISFDVGKDKEIGFMLNPEKKKAELGFKMKFDGGGVLQGYQDKGFVSKVTLEAEKNKTISQVLDEMVKEIPTQKATYNTAKKQFETIFKEIFPDTKFSLIKVKDISWDDTAKFLQIADKKGYGEGTLKTFGSMYKYVPDSTNHYANISSNPVVFKKLYTKKLTMAGTPMPVWDEAAEQSYKNLLEWLDEEGTFRGKSRRIEYKGLSPKHIGTVNGSINRLAKIQLLTGLRTIDIVRLRPEDISKDGFIRYLSAKGAARAQPLPVSDEVIKLLNEQLAAVGGKNGVKDFGGRLFGKKSGTQAGLGTIEEQAKAYEGAWNRQINNAIRDKRLSISIKNEATGKTERLKLKYARKYHAAKLASMGQSKYANQILGWAEGTEEGIKSSKMLDKVYAKTKGQQLVVDLADETNELNKLKTITNRKQIKIAETTGYKFTTTPKVSDLTIDKQIKDITKKDISVETKAPPGKGEIIEDSKIIVEDKPQKVDVKKQQIDVKKTLKEGDGVFTKATIAKYLKKFGPIIKGVGWLTGGLTVTQLLNELSGRKLLAEETIESPVGPIQTTLSGEAKSLVGLTTDAIYPEGHPKEGQVIHSVREYEQMQGLGLESETPEAFIRTPEKKGLDVTVPLEYGG